MTAATCRETGRTFALAKNYDACAATVPTSAGASVATKFRWSYSDVSRRTRFAGECEVDGSLSATITEDHASCDIAVDYNTGYATPQARLVYTDRNGQTVEARGCAASNTSAAVRLAADTGACDQDINLAGNSVSETASYSYVLGGVTRQASDCRTTGRTFAITRDDASCGVDENIDTLRATPHFRMIYADGAGRTRVARDCAADTARTATIREDFSNCSIAIDYAAGTATPHSKLVYNLSTARETTARDCQPSSSKRSITLSASSSSCTARVDHPGGVVHERATYTYTRDGGTVTAATCRETGRTFALVRNYDVCPDDVPESSGRSVSTNFRWSYLGTDNAPRYASACERDISATSRIAEDHSSCDIAIDYAAGTATPHSKLVYTDRNGQTIEARGCAASTSRTAVRLAVNVDACDQDIDLSSFRVAERASYSYVIDGVTRKASDCRATGRRFAITRDDTSCAPDENINTLRATARYRMVFENGAGATVVAQDCTFDSRRVVSIREDFSNCSVAIDYDANTATPQARLVYSGFDGTEVVVRECRPATSKHPVALSASSSSCPPRVNHPGGVVHERSTYTYTLDGGTVTASRCRETGNAFALRRNYDVCPTNASARVGASVATKYRWSYLDGGGKAKFASECETDTGVSATITEDHASCDIAVDYDAARATPQARLVYTDRNGQTVQARGCAASTSRTAVRLAVNVGACDQDVDIANRRVAERASYSYVLDGVTRKASDCRKTGRTFTITRDDASCETQIDLVAMRATARYRMVYENAAGATVVASDCANDTSRVVVIRENHDACRTVIDYAANTATPHSKLVYSDLGGQEATARACAPSTTKHAVSLDLDRAACPLLTNISHRRASVRANYSYTIDGATRRVANCRETGEHYALERGFAGCRTDVDVARGTAIQHFAWFYVDQNGENQKVGRCVRDDDLVFSIIEDHSACQVFIDRTTNKAVPKAALFYADRNGQRVEVRGCENSKSVAAVDLVSRTDTCPIKPDFPNGVSHQTGIDTYTLNGTTYQVASCVNTGVSYRHTKVYKDSTGRDLCRTIVNGTSATRQYRLRIVVDGLNRFVSACTPDPADSAIPIVATSDGCTDVSQWNHVLATGISYAQERHYYTRGDRRIYISACRDSATTYRHSHETIRYDYNDAQLTALPVTRVTITPPGGEYVVHTGRVLPGATQIPYTAGDPVDVPTGIQEYEGCTARETTLRARPYTRPDASTYNKPLGSGDRLPARDACRVENLTWVLGRHTRFNGSCRDKETRDGISGVESASRPTASANYTGTRTIVREDGTTIRREQTSFSRTTQGEVHRGSSCQQSTLIPAPFPAAPTVVESRNLSWHPAADEGDAT